MVTTKQMNEHMDKDIKQYKKASGEMSGIQREGTEGDMMIVPMFGSKIQLRVGVCVHQVRKCAGERLGDEEVSLEW